MAQPETPPTPQRGGSLIAHAATFASARIVASGLSVVTALLVIRALDKGEFGAYAIATGIASVLVMASDIGLTSSLARFIAEGRVDRQLALKVAATKLTIACLAALGMFGIAAAMRNGWIGDPADARDVAPLVVLASVLLVGQSLLGFTMGVLPSLQRVRMLSVLAIAQPALELCGMLAVVVLEWGARGAILASAAAAGVCGAIGLVRVIRGASPTAGSERQTLRGVRKYGAALLVVTVCYALFGQIDQLTIWFIHGSVVVASYAAVWKLITMMHLPGLAVATIVAPRFAQGDPEHRLSLYRRSLAALGLGYLSLVVVCAALAGPIVSLTLGADYAATGGLFVALALFAILLGTGPLATMAANFLGAARQRIVISAVALVLNAAIDIALVPSMKGYGAAIGTSVAYTWFIAAHVLLVERQLGGVQSFAALIRRARQSIRAGVVFGVGAALAGALIAITARGSYELLAGIVPDIVAVPVAGAVFLVVALASSAFGWRSLVRMERARALREHATSAQRVRAFDAPGVRSLHVCDYAAPYASAFIRQLRLLDEEMVRRGEDRVGFAFPESAAAHPWVDELRAAGHVVAFLSTPSPAQPWAQTMEIARLCVELDCSIVHTHFDAYDLSSAAAIDVLKAAGLRVPRLVWHYRTALEHPVSARGRLRRLKDWIKLTYAGRRADAYVGITQRMADEIVARGFPEARTHAIDAGCDVDSFARDDRLRASMREELGIADDQVLILHMGWHWHRKGGDLLADAGRQLEQRGFDNLVFASVGAPTDNVEAPVIAWPPSTRIHALHQAADIFVSAARSEAWGNATVEALACERVLVAAAAPGQAAVFEGLDGCTLVSPDNATALADGLEYQLRHREHWGAWGHSNRQRVIERYDMRRWAREMADLYDDLAPVTIRNEAIELEEAV